MNTNERQLLDGTLTEVRRQGKGFLMELSVNGTSYWGTMPRDMHETFVVGDRVVLTASIEPGNHFVRPHREV